MPEVGKTLDVHTARQWRRWLKGNHATCKEIWLVYHSKATGRPSLPYGDAVDQALCFGWIDGVVKSIGNGSRAQRMTPRRPTSNVSEINKARVRRLVREGQMTPAGLKALPGVDDWLDPGPLVVPADILKAVKADKDAWRHYQSFPETYRRVRVAWIDEARHQPEEFKKRLAHFVKKTAQGRRYGHIQE